LGEAQKYYSNHVGEMFSWDDKTAGNQVLLAQLGFQIEYQVSEGNVATKTG